MKDGKCPKCASTEIYQVPPGGGASTLITGFFTTLMLDHLICANCGYVEVYCLIPSEQQ